jgi:hypothetical protein
LDNTSEFASFPKELIKLILENYWSVLQGINITYFYKKKKLSAYPDFMK